MKIPGPHVPLVEASGLISPVWYQYFLERDRLKLTGLVDVETAAPSNGDVPIWNSTSSKFEFGAN